MSRAKTKTKRPPEKPAPAAPPDARAEEAEPDFAEERGPMATEFGSAARARETRRVNNRDSFHGN